MQTSKNRSLQNERYGPSKRLALKMLVSFDGAGEMNAWMIRMLTPRSKRRFLGAPRSKRRLLRMSPAK